MEDVNGLLVVVMVVVIVTATAELRTQSIPAWGGAAEKKR